MVLQTIGQAKFEKMRDLLAQISAQLRKYVEEMRRSVQIFGKNVKYSSKNC
jgi:hypothetical protein